MIKLERQESTASLESKSDCPSIDNVSATSANAHPSGEQQPSSRTGLTLQRRMFNQSVRNPIISIGVIDQHSFTRECITTSLKEFDNDIEILPFKTIEDCLRSTSAFELILYHVHERLNARYDVHLGPVKNLLEIAPVIILSPVDSPESVVEAFQSGARGYIPTTTTPVELAIEIIRLVRAGGTFVPPSGLPLQRTNHRDLSPRAATNQQFTPRQMAVLNYLTQGKANKIIAYELAMSESTVKVHIRNIMRKMNASNRTEAAYRARTFADMSCTATHGD